MRNCPFLEIDNSSRLKFYLSSSTSGSDELGEVVVLESVLSLIFENSWSLDEDVESSLGSGANSGGRIGNESRVSEGVLVGDTQWIGGQDTSTVKSVFDDESVVSADEAPNKVAFSHFSSLSNCDEYYIL